MNFVILTAEKILGMIKGIFVSEAINILNDEAKQAFGADTLQDALNMEYWTFNYRRHESWEQLEYDFKHMDRPPLLSRTKSFCLYTNTSIQNPYAKDVDIASASGTLDFWVQIDKIQIVEYLIAQVNNEIRGKALKPTFVNGEVRKVQLILDYINSIEYSYKTNLGDLAHMQINVLLYLIPDGTVTHDDYQVSISWTDIDGTAKSANLPLVSANLTNVGNPKSFPQIGNNQKVGHINLSSNNEFNFNLDGDVNNAFIQHITDMSFANAVENNIVYTLNIVRAEQSYLIDCVVQNHQISIARGTGAETHSVSFIRQGINVGITPTGRQDVDTTRNAK